MNDAQGRTENPNARCRERQSQVFSGLWSQAASRNLGRRVDRAMNGQGQRALKFISRGFHKVLILETTSRPGFNVRLCGFPEKPGLINSNEIVTFANPVETESLGLLLCQVDRWAAAYETLYGEAGRAVPAQSDAGLETPALQSETLATVENEEIREACDVNGKDTVSPVTTSTDDRDRMNVQAIASGS